MAPIHHSEEFPPDPVSARAARAFVAAHAQLPMESLELLELMASELVTNAILHARTPFRVTLTDDGFRLRLEVSDGSSVTPVLKDYGPDAITGRGLRIVRRLADRWGITAEAGGKTAWVELDLHGAAARPTELSS